MKLQSLLLNLLLRKPYFGYIASQLKIDESESIKDIQIQIGPTIRMLYNPEWLESLPEALAYGAVIHELLHLIFLHGAFYNGKKEHIWNIACDIAVNQHIDPSMLPEDAISIQATKKDLPIVLEPLKSAEYYYSRLIEIEPALNLVSRKGKTLLLLNDGMSLSAREMEQQDTSDINIQAAKSKLEDIAKQASSEGEIPGALKQLVEEAFGKVDVDWRNVLKKYLGGKGRMLQKKTMKKLSKRFDDMPGNKRSKGLRALVAIDESGSISNEMIMSFYTELMLIKRLTKSPMHITRFDSSCTKPVSLERFIKNRDRAKSGSTDFRPVFELADSLNSLLVVVFTDGDGIMPETIRQKVLWVLTAETKKPILIGDIVRFT